METGMVNTLWKHVKIAALLKNGKRTDPSKHRPLISMSTSCKLIEKLVRANIVDDMTQNDFSVKEKKCCFIAGMPTTLNYWKMWINKLKS